MKNLLTAIVEKNTLEAVKCINEELRERTITRLTEEKKRVAAFAFGGLVDESYSHTQHPMDSTLINAGFKHLGTTGESLGRHGNGYLDQFHYERKEGNGAPHHMVLSAVSSKGHAPLHIWQNGQGEGEQQPSASHAALKSFLHNKSETRAESEMKNVGEAFDGTAKNPKNHQVDTALTNHGFRYLGAKNGRHVYQHESNPEHRFDYGRTHLGNLAYRHYTGKIKDGKAVPTSRSPQTGDTEIVNHLKNYYGKKA